MLCTVPIITENGRAQSFRQDRWTDYLDAVELKRSRPPATIYGQVYLKMRVKQGGQVSDHFGNNIDLLFAHQLRGLITIPPSLYPECALAIKVVMGGR